MILAKKKLLKNFITILVCFLSIFFSITYFSISSKDMNIETSREISINYSIQEFNKGNYFSTSNIHIKRSVCKALGGEYCKGLDTNVNNVVSINEIWEDQGYFNFIFLIGSFKNFFNFQLEYEDLFYLEIFISIILLTIFHFLIYKNNKKFFIFSPLFVLLFFFLNFRGGFHNEISLMGYWTYPLLTIVIFNQFLLINEKNSKINFFFQTILFFLIGVMSMVRGDIGYMFLLIYLFFFIFFLKNKINFLKLIILLLIFFIPSKSFELIKNLNTELSSNALNKKEKMISKHPIWISIWTGLGYYENQQFKISDERAMLRVDEIYGYTQYQSNDFEQKIKKIIINDLKNNPKILFKNINLKIKDLITQKHLYDNYVKNVYFLSLLASLLVVFFYFDKKIFFVCFYIASIITIPSLIREPYMPYDSTFKSYIIFLPYLLFILKNKYEYNRY